MIYEHKIIETFVPFWKRDKEVSLKDASMQILNDFSSQGWEVVSCINEFKFLLRRSIRSGIV